MSLNTSPEIADYHYLVIDDDVLTTNLIIRMLGDMGAHSVDSTDDGESALQHIIMTKKWPDIIICALAVAKMDGVAFLRCLAEEQYTGGIILISSKSERILRIAVQLAEAHRLNVLGFLHKPFLAPALLHMLSRYKEITNVLLPLPSSLATPETLRAALEQDQIVPYFQPKISVKTGKVIGVEALARWQHPARGLIPAALFISVAEDHGLMGLLTQDILSKTIRYAVAWKKAGRVLPFAINLSASSLSDVDLPDRIEKELDENGIDPSHLTLEITETTICEDTAVCLEILLRLRLKGINLSIDDFGTGHSTMEQLHKMPFTELKIDRLFVTGSAWDDEARTFFQSSVTLAKELKLVTVAECVETQGDWDVSANLDCDIVQGFFVSGAVPGETFLKAA